MSERSLTSMFQRALSVLLLVLASAPGAASAVEVKANGYASSRNDATLASDSPLAQVFSVPGYRFLGEVNGQLRLTWSEGWDLFADASLFFSRSTGDASNPGIAALNGNTLVVNELYQNLSFTESLSGLVGRKRLVWGSGFALNPTDLLNPPKDPTDPAFQRAGQYLARLEYTKADWAASLVFAPEPLGVEAGLPKRLLVDSGGATHWAAAARYYRLLQNSDVNLVYLLTQRWAGDDRTLRSHVGGSFSRYFFTDYELHVEALVHRGSSARLFNHGCAKDAATLGACIAGQVPPVMADTFDGLTARVVVGTRYMFKDESLLSVEYFLNGEGLTGPEFDDRVRFLKLLPTLPPQALSLLSGGDSSGALPNRFTFDPARRHYAFVSYSKPRIRDDFTVGLSGLVGLEDGSGLVGPNASWSAREWLTLALYGFVPFGGEGTEFGMLPFRARVTGEIRVFY